MSKNITSLIVKNNLNLIDLLLLETLMFLWQCNRQRNPGKPPCVCPTTSWLAKKLGVTRHTISRHIAKLEACGAIRVVRRRHKNGKWWSNLYYPQGILNWGMARILNAVKGFTNRGTPAAHKLYVTNKNNNNKDEKIKKTSNKPRNVSSFINDLKNALLKS